jgi:hypothetical protein
LAALPHVPLLPETLRRLVLPRYMAAHVEYLASDRAHGAAELADYTVQVGDRIGQSDGGCDTVTHRLLSKMQGVAV